MQKWVESVKSDPLKWLPIGFSCIALFFSGMSWRESHKGRTLNEAVNRPVLVLDNVLFTPGPSSKGVFVLMETEFKNLGRITTRINRLEYTTSFVNRCEAADGKPLGPMEMKSTPETEVPPGMVWTDARPLMFSHCDEDVVRVYLEGLIYYTDETTGRKYQQDFSKIVVIPTKPQQVDSTPSP